MRPPEEPLYVSRPMLPDLADLDEQLREIWRSRWLTNNGQKQRQLEEELRIVLKVPALSLLTNGTMALMVAVKALNLKGEVLTTPFTFAASPHVLAWNQIRPVFCDIDEATLTIDPKGLERALSPQVTGILGVHVYGMPCRVNEIRDFADHHDLRVIYDGAHAFGTELDGVGIGNFGDVTMFSFHATKMFHTCEGGALTFRDPQMKPLIDLLKNFGIKNEEEVVLPGINARMNEIQAAIGLLNLRLLDQERAHRRRLVDTYKNNLAGIPGITVFDIPANVANSYTFLMIRIGPGFGLSRDEVYEKLKKSGIHPRKYFYPLCSDFECYRQLPSAAAVNLPVANKVAREVLCLPLYGTLPVQDVDRCCEILRKLRV